MKRLSLFIIILSISVALPAQKSQIETFEAENTGYFISPVETPFGIVFTDNYASKLYLLNQNSVKTLVESPGCGRYFSISPDGNLIVFKSIRSDGKQAPAVYNLSLNKTEVLSAYSDLSSQAILSDKGDAVFFNSASSCVKSNTSDKTIRPLKVSSEYSNITAISPDGIYVVYDNDQKNLILQNISSGEETTLPNDGKGVIYPKWSPDSKKILFQNRDMELLVYLPDEQKLYKIGKGGAGNWDAGSSFIVFQRTITDTENFILKSSDLFISDYNGAHIRQITFTNEIFEMTPSFTRNGDILYQTYDKRQIIRAKLDTSNQNIESSEIVLDNPQDLKPTFYGFEEFTKNKAIVRLSNPVPYVHQLYDAPTGRNGNAACAPTTSVMAAAYYNRLPKWPIAANNYPSVTGSNHFNDYSGYVLDRYRYNEHTFDAYSSTKNAYGGYAYMWVSPWSSPGSGGMQAFQNHHAMASGSYVWTTGCTFTKTQTEINGQWPHSICSWITMSGHLTLAVGYVVGQHTVIFNDPWGDKNTPGYPSYDGDDAYYDWPGYNNGYQNLDPDGSHGTVAWTLTARSSQPTYDPLTIENINYNHGFYLNNSQNGSIQNYYRHVLDPAGHSGHIWWTGGEGGASSDICYVSWTPIIPVTAIYKVEAYIPASFTDSYSTAAVTGSAYYKIHHAGGTQTVTVNQLANQGSWVDLGNYEFASGMTGYVYLGDAVATADNAKKVLFDAIRYTQVSVALQVDITHITCKGNNDGTATVTSVPGPAPYSYSWSHDPGNTGNTAVNLSPGSYTVTVTNGNADVYEETFAIEEAAIALSLSTTAVNPTTVGGTNGSITANVSGGVLPYTFSWSHDAGNTSNSAANLPAGEYTVSVSDAYGCQLQETLWLSDPDCCTLLFADFSTGLPTGWTNTVNPGGYASYIWQFDDPAGRFAAGSLAGADFDDDFAIFDDDYYGDNGNKSDASLTTRAVDCSGKNNVLLKMTHRFRSSTYVAVGKLEVSNDGSTWNLIDSWSTLTEGAVIRTWDISAYAADQPSVFIRWTYTDDSNFSNYWAVDNVEVFAPLSGTFTVKTDGTGDYGSLSDAVNDLNHCGVGSGGVTFLVQSGDVFTEELPLITASGTAANPILFVSSDTEGPNPVLRSSGAGGTEAGIALAGGDYFTFNGLDIQISTGTSLEYGYWLYNTSSTNGCQHNTIKNCNITLNRNNQTSKGIFQSIQTGLINPTSADGANSFNTYENISISNAYHGIDLFGYDVAGQSPLYDDACSVSSCTISDFGLAGATADRATGILVWSQKNLSINNNTISDGLSADRTLGIYCAGNCTGNISENTVRNLYGTGLQVVGIRSYESSLNIYQNDVSDVEGVLMASGIESFGGTSGVFNNFVYDIKAPSGNSVLNGYPSVRGISLRFTSGIQAVYYNSVYLAYYSTHAGNESTCLYLESASVDLRNNIFENNTDAGIGTRANVLYFKTATDLANLSANSDHNCYYNGIANAKYALAYDAGNALSYLDLPAYRVPSPNDVNSIEENPPFRSTVSPYDLHIDVTQTSGINNGGIHIPGYTTDFDGETRDVSNPDIGADEYSSGGPLCGSYTINNTLPASGSNFINFTVAINTLNDRGISCDVLFYVSADQSFPENPPAINATGTSDNSITFQKYSAGNNPVILPIGSSADNDFGIHINGGDWLTFDGIDIAVPAGGALEYGYYLSNASQSSGAQHNTIMNCTVTLDNANPNSVGIFQNILPEIIPTSASGANSFNTYDNITVLNAFHGFKLCGYDVTGQEALYDDGSLIMNSVVDGFGYPGAMLRAVGILTWSQKNLSVHHNTIFNGTTDYRTLGIYGAGNNEGSIFNNTVYSLYGTGAQVVGLRSWESTLNFYNNSVYDIEGVDMASGIEVYMGTSYIYNNLIRDIRTPATDTYNYPTTRGISNRAATTYIYNNSVLLNYTSTAANNESAGIFVEGFSGDLAMADIRNNCIVNNTDVTIGSVAAALYKSAEYSSISPNSDNNLWFAGNPSSKNLIYYDTNTAFQNISDYQTWCATYEQNSVSFDAPYISTSNLHIATSSVTSIDGGAQPILLVSEDFDGDIRDALLPDIGADEFDCDYLIWRGNTSNDWATASNWHNPQVPTLTDYAYIPDVSSESNRFPIISSVSIANHLTILSGANLQINPDYSLTVSGILTNNAGTSGLLINSDETGIGSLIHSSSDVPATVERFLSGTQWHYLTSPIEDAPLTLFNTNNFYWYDETTEDSWSGGTFNGTMGWTVVSAPTLTSMQGYAYYFSPSTLSFEGNLHTGTYSSPLLSYTNTPMADQYDGWHLLGNPYPSAIDWDSEGVVFSGLDQTVYFYDDLIDNYRYYNRTTGGVNGGTQYVPISQGFFVHTSITGAQLQLNNNARVHNTSDFYKQSPDPKELSLISLRTSGNGLEDETKIVVLTDASSDFDGAYDAYKMYTELSEVPFIYSLNNESEFAINAISSITENLIIPLGFYSVNTGTYEINLYEETIDLPVYLYDHQENLLQNLTETPSYAFQHNGGNTTDRFELRFSDGSYIENEDRFDPTLYPNPSNGIFTIQIPGYPEHTKVLITIKDVSGKAISKSLFETVNDQIEMNISDQATGIYFVEIRINQNLYTIKLIKQ
jgi:hypothetical protein